jgi:hypothetical protein
MVYFTELDTEIQVTVRVPDYLNPKSKTVPISYFVKKERKHGEIDPDRDLNNTSR